MNVNDRMIDTIRGDGRKKAELFEKHILSVRIVSKKDCMFHLRLWIISSLWLFMTFGMNRTGRHCVLNVMLLKVIGIKK